MWNKVVRRAVALFAEVDGESEGGTHGSALGAAGAGRPIEEQGQLIESDEDWVSVLWSDAE